MEFIDYILYIVAGLSILLAIGGISTNNKAVVLSSVASLGLNGYAIYEMTWWPILVSFVIGVIIKSVLGDPGASGG